MSNLVKWIEEEANGEEIEAVVIGEMGWGSYGSDRIPNYDAIPKNTVLSWDEARKHLDYDFDAGFGAPGCQAVYVWTDTWVLFISQYDGATNIHSIPRNPTDIMPTMPGG